MSDALRAQERLHNALVRLENHIKDGLKGTSQGDLSVSAELNAVRAENEKLRDAQKKAKLRLDKLIETLESEEKKDA